MKARLLGLMDLDVVSLGMMRGGEGKSGREGVEGALKGDWV